jgi:hypothetical protein
MARIVELILTYHQRGIGTHDDPIRHCPQLFTKTGELVAEMDPMPKGDIANPRSVFNPHVIYQASQQ